MYILKNAIRNVSRSKGRSALIGVIVLVIAVSCCISLSIRQAAESARQDGLDSLNVTAAISVDRSAMMKNFSGGSGDRQQFDPNSFRNMYSEANSLTLDDFLYYAQADSVRSFYYQMSASLNGNDLLSPVETSSSSGSAASGNGARENDRGGMGQGFQRGDFTVIGYGSDEAMTEFVGGTCRITDGAMFDEGTSDQVCVISSELATYNSLSVGDRITLVNPSNETETYTLEIVGIYENSQSSAEAPGIGGFSFSDPANEIYTSYNALKAITDASASAATETTDSATGQTTSTKLSSQLSATYTFASVSDYERFQTEVRDMGLSDTYTVSSADLTQYEQSLVPLENLSKFALYFLIIVLVIGAIILVVLNAFNIRERKYEIGVLTAIGMKKRKVALQFIAEIFAVTISVFIIGSAIGAAVSLPVTNKLLESQVASQQNTAASREQSFGRQMGGAPGNDGDGKNGGEAPSMPTGGFRNMFGSAANYISQVSSATNWTVVLELLGLGILLTLVAGLASLVFIMRYEPLRILSNRD